MGWLPAACEDAQTPLDAVFGLRPNLYEDFRRFYGLFWERRLVEPVRLELCRLRVAQLLGCDSELAVRYQPALDAGLTEEKVTRLASWRDDPAFDAAERACLGFAEKFVTDPHAIDDADAAAVVEHLGDAGTVALTEALALFDGFARFRAVLGIEPRRSGVSRVPGPSADAKSLP
jgi:alkylhydroperoxidase family enzyme